MSNPSRAEPRGVGVRLACAGALIPFYAWLFVNGYRRIGGDTGDFRHFYYAAKAMLGGQDIYASGVPGMRAGYIYPPLLAFLYTPYATLAPHGAALAMLITNLALAVLTTVVACRTMIARFDGPRTAGMFAATFLLTTVLISDKIKGETQMWQTNVLVLLMFTLGLAFLDRRPWLCGLALGLAVNIKYLPIVMLPYLLLRRRWSAAGWFALWTIVWALVPAVLTGWERNLGYLRTAMAGMLRMAGLDAGPGPVADVEPLTSAFSVSATSAVARLFGGERATVAALAGAVVLGLACLGLAAWMYRRRGMPLLLWPGARAQEAQPFKAMVAVEWVGLIVVVLALGPQTNPRHLYLLMLVLAAAAVMLLAPRPGVGRLPLVLGTLVLCAGLYLPPGGARFGHWVQEWRIVGGPSWCLLVMYGTLLWTGLKYSRREGVGAGASGAQYTAHSTQFTAHSSQRTG